MEISNNILAALVLVAMVVSLAGTMSMMSVLPGKPVSLTGMQTLQRTGIANVTLESEAHIQLLVDTVEFGTIGSVVGTTNNTIDFSPHPLVLENNGTVIVNVSIGESTGSGSGPLWDNDDSCEYCFQFNSTRNGTASGAVQYASWTNFEGNAEAASAGALSTDPANLVYNLTSVPGGGDADKVTIHLNISVPASETGGVKEATIYFLAAQVS